MITTANRKKYRKIINRAKQYKRQYDSDTQLGWAPETNMANSPIEGPTFPNNNARTPIDSLGNSQSGNTYPFA